LVNYEDYEDCALTVAAALTIAPLAASLTTASYTRKLGALRWHSWHLPGRWHVSAAHRTTDRGKDETSGRLQHEWKQQHSASISAVVLSGIPAGFSYQSERRK